MPLTITAFRIALLSHSLVPLSPFFSALALQFWIIFSLCYDVLVY